MTRAPAGGFTLVSAIFLMVVLAVLAVSLVSLSSVQHTTTAQTLQAMRAVYAARAGVEWAVRQAQTVAGCPAGPTNIPLGGTLNGFTVSVACTRTEHTLAAGSQPYYVVDVTTAGGAYGGPVYVSRRVQTKVLGPEP